MAKKAKVFRDKFGNKCQIRAAFDSSKNGEKQHYPRCITELGGKVYKIEYTDTLGEKQEKGCGRFIITQLPPKSSKGGSGSSDRM